MTVSNILLDKISESCKIKTTHGFAQGLLFVMILLAYLVLAITGYTLNITTLYHLAFNVSTIPTILVRVLGVFVPSLGMLIGWIN